MELEEELTYICDEPWCGRQWNGNADVSALGVQAEFLMPTVGRDHGALRVFPPAFFSDDLIGLKSDREFGARHGAIREVAGADDVITNTECLLQETESGHFSSGVRNVVITWGRIKRSELFSG